MDKAYHAANHSLAAASTCDLQSKFFSLIIIEITVIACLPSRLEMT